jgi:hypothetical protein
VVLEEALHPLLAGDARPGGVGVDGHALPHPLRARPDEVPADLDPAGVACLERAKTGVIADGGQVDPRSRSLQGRNQGLSFPAADDSAIDVYRDDRLFHVRPFLIVDFGCPIRYAWYGTLSVISSRADQSAHTYLYLHRSGHDGNNAHIPGAGVLQETWL